MDVETFIKKFKRTNPRLFEQFYNYDESNERCFFVGDNMLLTTEKGMEIVFFHADAFSTFPNDDFFDDNIDLLQSYQRMMTFYVIKHKPDIFDLYSL